MIEIQKSDDRGRADFGWLRSKHSFSFGNYYHPKRMGWRSLRVLNEDWVEPKAGFGEHAHQDMEIVSYVLEGALAHRDSLGNGSTLRAGSFQRMTAGTGVRHSEMNPSDGPTRFIQIWILPREEGLTPSYEELHPSAEQRQAGFVRVASGSGAEGALTIHQDVELFVSELPSGGRLDYELAADRHAWLQVVRGELLVNGHRLEAGDGAAVSEEQSLAIDGIEPAEFLLFDLG